MARGTQRLQPTRRLEQYEIRNAAYNWSGGVDCEINHPDFGWIPHTVDPANNWDLSKLDIAPYAPTPLTAHDVRLEARRRIDATDLSWMVERAATGGKAVPQAISDYAATVRAASNAMESDPPADYRDNRHWPKPPAGKPVKPTTPKEE